MKKPIVFLSHSSKDKTQLAALKTLLDKRAAGSLEFFLSSDGQSIPLGRNWLVRISDALAEAKLMFVFISSESVDSTWVHFEAGHAYAKGIEVVPVCLPGMNFNGVGQPLNILQGFNLHSHESMANLARKCNEVCDRTMEETFSNEEFRSIFSPSDSPRHSLFGDFSWAVKQIRTFAVKEVVQPWTFDALPVLANLAQSAELDMFEQEPDSKNRNNCTAEIELPGCSLWVGRRVTVEKEPNKPISFFEVHATLSPQLLESNADLLERWYKEASFAPAYRVVIELEQSIKCESVMHVLTTKLHKSNFRHLGGKAFRFDHFVFEFGSYASRIEFQCEGKLREKPLYQVISKLFDLGVIFRADTESNAKQLSGLDRFFPSLM